MGLLDLESVKWRSRGRLGVSKSFVIRIAILSMLFLHSMVGDASNEKQDSGVGEESQLSILHIGVPLLKEALHLKGGSRTYEVVGLRASTSYEIKVSYPASVPASFKLEFVEQPVLAADGKKTSTLRSSRKLLDTEKIIFYVDGNGQVQADGGGSNGISYVKEDGSIAARVRVTVKPGGVRSSIKQLDESKVLFNIECEPLLLNLPVSVWHVITIGVFCIVGIIVAIFVLPQHWLPRFLRGRHIIAKQRSSLGGEERKERPYGREARAALERRTRNS